LTYQNPYPGDFPDLRHFFQLPLPINCVGNDAGYPCHGHGNQAKGNATASVADEVTVGDQAFFSRVLDKTRGYGGVKKVGEH